MSHLTHSRTWYALCPLVLLFSFTLSHAQTDVSFKLATHQTVPESWFGYNGQNVIRDGISWVNPDLISNLPKINPHLIRYPSGFAFWDWKRGWFIDSPILPDKYAQLERQPNYLENFKIGLDACDGADALFVMNMVTATLQDQISMLKHADSIGIPVKYIELGSEVYLATDDEDAEQGQKIVDSIYPSAASYALACNIWIDSLHKHFPGAKVAVDGAFEKFHYGRRGTWNDSIRPLISGREDAWTFHIYFHAAWNDSAADYTDLVNVTSEDVPDWMFQPHAAIGVLDQSIADVNPGKEIWITEFNLHDESIPVQGLWGHGLWNSLLTMLMLREPNVTHVTCHAVDGSALYGQYFTDSLGFQFFPEEDSTPLMPNPPTTFPWNLSASGQTMKSFGAAIQDMNSFCDLMFSQTPIISTIENYGKDTMYYSGLEGIVLSNSAGSNTFIMNLTDKNYKLHFNGVYPAGTTYESKYADPIVPIAKNSDVTIESGTLSSQYTLKPYSILKIHSSFIPATAPTVHITANGSTTFCEGDSVQLDAGPGYLGYTWSTGSHGRKIWVKSSGDYYVQVNSAVNAYAGGDTITIVVNPNPDQPNIMCHSSTEFCQGYSRILTIKSVIPDDVTYQWNTGVVNDSLTVTSSGQYWVTFTNEFGCTTSSDPKTITVYPLPIPYITTPNGTIFCDGGNISLTANPSGMTYKWSNGTNTQTTTVTKSSTLSVTITDGNGCKATTPTTSVTRIVLDNPTITNVGPMTYCTAETPTYLQTIAGFNYQWLKGTTAVSGATNQTYTPGSTGTYKVRITDVNGCTKTTTNGKTLTINSSPTASIIATQLNICGVETSLLTEVTGLGQTYQWKKNGGNISGATLPTYVATKAASYTCKVTKTSGGCIATSNSINITANCKTEEESSSSNGEGGELSLFPNPARDELHISATFSDNASGTVWLELRNTLGQLVYREQFESTDGRVEETIKLSNQFAAGLYLVNLRQDDHLLTGELIVK